MSKWHELAERVIAGHVPTRQEALDVLRVPDEGTRDLLDAAYAVRKHFHGNRVKVHVLMNAKSGYCPEDCGFCSQSRHAESPINKFPLVDRPAMVAAAKRADAAGAYKFCIVTATRGPSDQDLDEICAAVEEIKRTTKVRVCTSLGLLDAEKARRLKAAGVDRFNHNLETSERRFGDVCTTHSYADRVNTVKLAQEAGMEACCGGIIGMGETHEDVVDMAFAVRELGVTSIPVNFLDPRPGTPMAGAPRLTPEACLRALCLFRFVNPERDIRAAGGREVNLRDQQYLSLYAANSIFSDGYLTTPGAGADEDRRAIESMGFEIVQD